MKKSLNILIVTPWYPHPGNALFGVFVRHFAELLSARHKITVVALIENSSDKSSSLIRKSVSPNFEEIIQIIPKASNPVARMLARKRATRHLVDNFIPALKSFDLIHFHVLSSMHFDFFRAAQALNIPYVITEHWTMYARGLFEKQNFITRSRLKMMARNAKALMPVSSFLQKNMERCGIRANYVVVPNMVPEVSSTNLAKYEQTTLLGVGDLVDGVKNFSGMIMTLKALHAKNHKYRLHIVGLGPDKKKLEALSEEMGLHDFVIFQGELPHEKVLEEMQRCHVYLMASTVETFSISTLEALKCGTPIVTSDCGGINDYFEDLAGVMVSPFDPEHFANAVISIIEHPEWYQKEALRNAFGPKCTPQRVIEELNAVYINALSK